MVECYFESLESLFINFLKESVKLKQMKKTVIHRILCGLMNVLALTVDTNYTDNSSLSTAEAGLEGEWS